MNKLIIIGAGSVGKFLAYNSNDFVDHYSIIGFVDDDPAKQHQDIAGYPVLGCLDLLNEYSGKGYFLVIGIAFPKVKCEILKKISHLDFFFPSFISKKAWLSKEVTIGIGCIIYPGVSVNYETNIADFVVINMNCAIGHNSIINSYTSLAPGVNLAGFTILHEAVNFGIGAATKQNIVVHQNAIIGGQAMLINDVDADAIVFGILGQI